MAITTLPDDVRSAFLRRVKGMLLDNYAGGFKKLEPWNDFRAGLVGICSFLLPGDRAKNLRSLDRLAKAGVILEKPRYRKGIGTRVFTLPREQLDVLAEQATREHEAAGYVLGVMMPAIKPSAAALAADTTFKG